MGNVTIRIQDHALGLVPAPSDNVALLIGVSSQGEFGRVYSFTDPGSVRASLGYGPLVEQAAYVLSVAGGTVRCVRVEPTTNGEVGEVEPPHPGAGELSAISTATYGPHDSLGIVVRITRGGGPGAGAFRYSLDRGETMSAEIAIPLNGLHEIPEAGVQIEFEPEALRIDDTQKVTVTGSAGTFKLSFDGKTTGDIAFNATAEAVREALAQLESVGGIENVHCTGGPLATDPVVVEFRGALGGQDQPQMTYDASGLTGTVVIETVTDGQPGTEYRVDDEYEIDTTEPTYGAEALTSALGDVFEDTSAWSFCHVIARPATASDARGLASALSAKLSEVEATLKRFVFGIVDHSYDGDEALESAFQSFVSTRVGLAAGRVRLRSPLSGRIYGRPAAWPLVARLCSIPVSEHPGRVRTGPVRGVDDVDRDERLAARKLAEKRFNVLQTYPGRTGFYIANSALMASEGSDFGPIQNRRVMDKACAVAYATLLDYLNDAVRVNGDGTIHDRDRVRIEDHVAARLAEALVNTGDATAVSAQVNRTTNIVSTKRLDITLRVRPLGYAEHIEADIGFEAPQTVSA